MARRRFNFPVLDPGRIADEVEGGCQVLIYKARPGPWEVHFLVQLKRSVKDRDLDLEALRRGFWIGFDGEGSSRGWNILRASITESTLIMSARYRKDDLRRLEHERVVRLAPSLNLLGVPAGALLELRSVRFPNDKEDT